MDFVFRMMDLVLKNDECWHYQGIRGERPFRGAKIKIFQNLPEDRDVMPNSRHFPAHFGPSLSSYFLLNLGRRRLFP